MPDATDAHNPFGAHERSSELRASYSLEWE